MKKILFIFIILCCITFLSSRNKTEKIGATQWFTEQNSFEEIIKISQKDNKPILGVFSAKWCGPCKFVKQDVFKHKSFDKIKEKVVLLYIEETTKEGKNYTKKFKIKGYPTFKIFSKDGILLDTGYPKRTVNGFLKWIDDVKSGNNYYELSQKIKKNPKNRKALIKIVDKMGSGKKELKIKHLINAIKINPDINDAITQEAYEKLMSFIVNGIPYRDGKEKNNYLKINKKYISKIIKSYYSDKFKHRLKGNYGILTILKWYNKNKEYKNSIKVFNDFIKSKNNSLNLSNEIRIIHFAFEGLLNTNQLKLANMWLNKIIKLSINNADINDTRSFNYYHNNSYIIFIDYFGKKGNLKATEKYADLYYKNLIRLGYVKVRDFRASEYAAKYGVFANKIIEELETKNKILKGVQLARSTSSLSTIYFKVGKRDKAKQILIDLYNNKEYLKSIKQKNLANILNTIAWTFIEIKSIDKTALKISREAVKHSSDSNSLDTLATILAGLGNYKEAIKIENEAIRKSNSIYNIKTSKEKIKKWKKNI